MVAIEDKTTPTIIYPPPEVRQKQSNKLVNFKFSYLNNLVLLLPVGAKYCGQNCGFRSS